MELSDQELMAKVDKLEAGISGIELQGMIEVYPKTAPRILSGSLKIERTLLEKSLSEECVDSCHFSSSEAEIILDAIDICERGVSVFRAEGFFYAWTMTEVTALAHRRPIDLIGSFAGREWVRRVLGRIEHGVFS